MPLKQSTFNFAFLPVENRGEETPSTGEKKQLPKDRNQDAPEIDLDDTAGSKPNSKRDIIDIVSKELPINIAPKKSARGRMKLSDMNASAELVEVPEDAVLFEKSYYSIGAVSEMFKVNQSLIRFWENEFNILKPKKNAKGDRFFRPEDVKNLKLIYHLLRERKYTIEGAKEFLKKNKNADKKFQMIEALKKIKGFLNELKANL